MRKLVLPSLSSDDIYTQVVKNCRDESKKEKLEAIKSVVFERYSHYEDNSKELKHISQSPISQDDEKDYLKSNYSRNKDGYLEGEVVSAILKAQSPQLRNTCPYCGIDKPRTIDHYLPQSLFPEYAIYPSNLIPCCGYCNSKKGKRWIHEGDRMFINFYFDELPYETIFLEVEFNYLLDDEVPKISFNLTQESIDKDQFKLIESHYSRLELKNEYAAESDEEISNIRQLIVDSPETSLLTHIANLKRNLKVFEKKYGVNYWKSALYRGIINSDFLIKIK